VSVGDLFKAALWPGLILVGAYILYIIVISIIKPHWAPLIDPATISEEKLDVKKVVIAFLLPFLLILAVLGSIFAGIASPTEAAAVGALGATILTILQRKFNLEVLREVMRGTTHLTSMVFIILIGATTFALVFRGLDGDKFLVHMIESANLSGSMFLVLVLIVVFILGFFIDFIEIIFIVVPIVSPIFVAYGMDLIWIGILLALNLQTSFLTPPFGFSLFYLKGVSPPEVTTAHIYRGVLPFLIIQLILLIMAVLFPHHLGIL
jgi:tripartite ATP-independent transporter DctM subunit